MPRFGGDKSLNCRRLSNTGFAGNHSLNLPTGGVMNQGRGMRCALRKRSIMEALEPRRLLSSIAADPGFGSGGSVASAFPRTVGATALAMKLAPDGSMVVMGQADLQGRT